MREFQLKLAASRGEIPADLLIKNAQLVNVFSGEIYTENIAVYGERFIGFGDYDAKETIDASGLYVAPGFIDGHMHFESTMLTLQELSRAVMPHGTTAVVIDPHEIANVLGLDGIRYVLQNIDKVPLEIFVMLPSCVPATHLETSGATITHKELNYLIQEDSIAGIGEMMNFPAVISGDKETHQKISAAKWKKVDGHAPAVTGKNLNAYILSKITSDHESTSAEEALEKLRKGMHILIREGTSERNLEEVISIVTRENSCNFSFATDDKHPDDIVNEGHINFSVKKAISLGLNPMTAYQIATINTANYYNLKNIGAIKPRYKADFVLLSDLEKVKIEAVYKNGKAVFKDRKLKWHYSSETSTVRSTMDPEDFTIDKLKIPANGKTIRVIDIIPNQIITEEYITNTNIIDGFVEPDISNDILKIVVIERHKSTGNIGKGFVRGLGMKEGAIGSTIAHDSHNIVIIGTNDEDIYAAFQHLKKLKGGLVAVKDNKVLKDLPLPIAGLISNKPYEEVVEGINGLKKATNKIGCTHESPFMILSFLSLSPIPKLKITDLGLIDVSTFATTSLFPDESSPSRE